MNHALLIREREALSPETAEFFVRATLGGVNVDGYPTPLQYELIRQVAEHVFGLTVDVTTLEPLDAAAAKELIDDPALARRLVQAIVTLEMLDDPVPPALATHIRRYARTLDVDEPMVNAARHAARGHMALMYADIQRNSYYTHEAIEQAVDGHLWRVLRSKFAYSNLVASRSIERKWAALADMPKGSLGHTTAEFYRVHEFPIPGARHGIGEIGAQHDFVHVLVCLVFLAKSPPLNVVQV